MTKVVRSGEMPGEVQTLREMLHGLGEEALRAVKKGLREKKSGWLAYKLLSHIGVVPSPWERQAVPVESSVVDKAELTPLEQMIFDKGTIPLNRISLGLVRSMVQACEEDGFTLPTPEEIRHRRRVRERYRKKHGDGFVMEPDRDDWAEAEAEVRKQEEAEKVGQAPEDDTAERSISFRLTRPEKLYQGKLESQS